MDTNSLKFPITVVSTDTTALREITWTLSEYGYRGVPTSDWGEHASWRRAFGPALVIMDSRDEQQAKAALSASRAAPFTYRIALFDTNMLNNPDVLTDLGADDLVRYPLNVGELLSCLRRGTRRLEFERRLSLNATFDQQRGVASRRGFTLQLGRKLEETAQASGGTLVVLGIDFLETIREQHGTAAVENACSLAAEMLFSGLTPQDCRGTLAEGIFAVHLQEKSVSDGVLFANEVNEQCAVVNGRGTCISLSGVVTEWPSGESAELAIHRTLAALEHLKGWGGSQVLDIKEVEREYAAWKQRFPGLQKTDARHAMEALPLVLPLNNGLPAGGLKISSFATGSLPLCVPVVDDIGHLVGVVSGETFQAHGKEVFNALDEYLEPVSASLRGDSRLDEMVASLEAVDSDYLLVLENKKPIGYVTKETVAALQPKAPTETSGRPLAAADYGLSSLAVPLI